MKYCAVAASYAWLERLVFGGRLQQCRVALIPELENFLAGSRSVRILIVADGDGRFLEALLQGGLGRRRGLSIDVVELSESMLQLARDRAGDDARISWINGDVRDACGDGYDAVVSHFFLDQFSDPEHGKMVACLAGKVRAGGVWLESDFCANVSWWWDGLLAVMYRFFGLVAGVRNRKLVDAHQAMMAVGMEVDEERHLMRGFLRSTIWRKLNPRVAKSFQSGEVAPFQSHDTF